MSEKDPNQLRLLEIYGTITIITILFRVLALIIIAHVIKVQKKQQKLRKRQPIIANDTDQLLYGPNLNNLKNTGIF